jgi:HSP20 family protein
MALAHWPYDSERSWPEEILRSFAPFLKAQGLRSAGVFPAVNIYDDGESFLVRAEIPGVDKDGLEVTVKSDQLTVRGERKIASVKGKASYHRRERESGQFRRTVTLPQPVDADKISANYKNGVLEVTLPRLAEAQPRKISIH